MEWIWKDTAFGEVVEQSAEGGFTDDDVHFE